MDGRVEKTDRRAAASGFKAVLLRELSFLRRDKTFLLSIVIIPIITMLFLVALFYKGVPHDMPIAVVNHDNTPLSRQVVQMIDATQSVAVAYELSSVDEGREMMMRGDVSGVVVVPVEFEKDILGGVQTECSAFISGLNILVGSLLERDITTAVKSFSTGIEMQKLRAVGKTEQEITSITMPIYYDTHILFNPYTSYAYYLLPGFMPMMIILMVLLCSAYTFGREFKYGSGKEWLERADGSIFVAVAGKMLPYTILFLFHLLIMNYLIFDTLAAPMIGSKGLLLASGVLLVLAYQMIGVMIVAISANMRLSMSLAAGYGVLAFTFSGLTFPFVAMSAVVAACGNLFPLTFYMKVYIDQAMRGAPSYVSYLDLAILLVFIVIALLSLFRLKAVVGNSRYWGRS